MQLAHILYDLIQTMKPGESAAPFLEKVARLIPTLESALNYHTVLVWHAPDAYWPVGYGLHGLWEIGSETPAKKHCQLPPKSEITPYIYAYYDDLESPNHTEELQFHFEANDTHIVVLGVYLKKSELFVSVVKKGEPYIHGLIEGFTPLVEIKPESQQFPANITEFTEPAITGLATIYGVN